MSSKLSSDDARAIVHLLGEVSMIDGYVKDVFRFFHVHSQPELIAKFQNGDGGDAP